MLKTNIPFSSEDIQKLEEILWSEVGSRQDYQNEIGEKLLGVFVREFIGLDMSAAKTAFSKYLNEEIMIPSDYILQIRLLNILFIMEQCVILQSYKRIRLPIKVALLMYLGMSQSGKIKIVIESINSNASVDLNINNNVSCTVNVMMYYLMI